MRELLFQNYRIIYLMRPDTLYVVTVVHGSRVQILNPKRTVSIVVVEKTFRYSTGSSTRSIHRNFHYIVHRTTLPFGQLVNVRTSRLRWAMTVMRVQASRLARKPNDSSGSIAVSCSAANDSGFVPTTNSQAAGRTLSGSELQAGHQGPAALRS